MSKVGIMNPLAIMTKTLRQLSAAPAHLWRHFQGDRLQPAGAALFAFMKKSKTVTAKPVKATPKSNVKSWKGKPLILRPMFSRAWLEDVKQSFQSGYYFRESLPLILPGEMWIDLLRQAEERQCSLTEIVSDALEAAHAKGGAR
jgi:hypothetical protein